MDDETREDWLRNRQDGRIYPLGRALRRTYGADNHASLGDDVTGLMIDLSKLPYEPAAEAPVTPPVLVPHQDSPRRSVLGRLRVLLARHKRTI